MPRSRQLTPFAVALCAAVGLPLSGCGSTTPNGPTVSAAPTQQAPTSAPRNALIGRWDVTTVRSGNAKPLKAMGSPYMVFKDDGVADGFDAVNNWSGRFVADTGGLRLSDVMTTLVGLLRTAPKALRDTQAAFVVLTSGRTVVVHVDGPRMTLVLGTYTLTATRHN